MILVLEDAVLGSLLDCQNFDLLNVGLMIPVPTGLVNLNDPALNDPRVPPLASVRDEHVSISAAIDQSKLSFDAEIPLDWLGTGSTQAATGDLVERVGNKGAHSGYVPLDDTLKIPATHVNAGINPGTVNSVSMIMPPEILVTGSPILSDAGSFDATWGDVPNGSYLGVNGPSGVTSDYLPGFIPGPLPVEIVPDLDASSFTSGKFPVEQLPVATSVSGIVPDPGEFSDPQDYLGRDMEWHIFGADISYQPVAPTPTITLDSWNEDEVFVTVRSALPGSSVFIRINAGPWRIGQIKKGEADVHDTVSVQDGDLVWAYAAKAGYNNSVFIPGGHANPWKVKTPLTEILPT